MYTVPAQSIIGRLFSNPDVHAPENASDSHPERPRIHTDGVDGELNSSNNVREFESILSAFGTQQTSYDGTQISASLPQTFSSNSSTLSPAALFLSGFSTSPSTLSLPDDEGEVVAGYTLGPIIGYGGFSIVRRASSLTSGGVVAVKIVRRSDLSKQGNTARAQKRLDHETQIWASLSHEHILPLFTSLHTSYADFFVTLYCPAGSLFDILKREGRPALEQEDVGTMFRQLVRGTRYLHEVANTVHRDLKLENILVDESGTCKITDFGMARKIGEMIDVDEEEEEDQENADGFVDVPHGVHRAASVSYATPLAKLRLPLHKSMSGRGLRHRNSTTTSMSYGLPRSAFQPGSLPYAAPELLLPPSNSEPCLPDPAQDMWALGVILYTLLSGRLPFLDSFEPRLQMKIMHGAFDMPSGVGRGTERVLRGLMDKNAVTRWTVAMADEVSWGVGWGEEGDSVPVTDDELRQETLASTSRSQFRPQVSLLATSPIAEVESNGLCSAGSDASARRSASRAQRSLSRAPISRRRSLSKRGEQDRRRSSSRHPSPPTSALESSILSLRSSSTHSSISLADPLEPDCALILSPSPLRGIEEERGRRLKKSSHLTSISRSPSPSVLPSTPSDMNHSRFISPPPPPLSEQQTERSRNSSTSIPRGRLRFSRLAPSHQTKSGTHTPLERHSTPDVFTAEDEPGWHIPSVEDRPLQDGDGVDVNVDIVGIDPNMAMDQDYLTSSEPYFINKTSPPVSETYPRPIFQHRPGSIVQTTSEDSGLGSLASPTNDIDSEPRKGHISSSLERPQHFHHHPSHHFHHPYSVKKQMRAGSTPPAPLSSMLEGGHTNTLRFADHKSHSHSASHTPFSVYSHSHSSSRTSFGLLSSDQTGSIRAMPVTATVTPIVVSGVTVASTGEGVPEEI